MMKHPPIFDVFVLPFSLGLLFLIYKLVAIYGGWIKNLSPEEKTLIKKNIWSRKTWTAIKDVFRESLLHVSMFKQNRVLGYMHASLAFGWFLLIITGAIESRFYNGPDFHWPYYPIFLKFFVQGHPVIEHKFYSVPGFFRFLMDFLLLLVLSGLLLAFAKRIRKALFGMKRTTKHSAFDRLAIASLWCIFPLRLLSESLTCINYPNGSFLTNGLGHFFESISPDLYNLAYPCWWLYSLALGVFFVTMPYSRYMHIFTEVVFIFFKNWGLKTGKTVNSFAEMQINACPRCGVCIDACPVYANSPEKNIIPAYFFRDYRRGEITMDGTFHCLECGRCQEVCPVHIGVNDIRTAVRSGMENRQQQDYSFLPKQPVKQTEVLYFAGCMTHLTPSVKRAVTAVLSKAGVQYEFLDKDGSICCGRPQRLAGNDEAAQQLADKNKSLIIASGAKILLTSCPICYKIFKEEYQLGIEVLHHTQYFMRLAEERKINLQESSLRMVYHDPCELGRGSGIYEMPRTLLKQAGQLIEAAENREHGYCCGGSIGAMGLSPETRDNITKQAIIGMTSESPDCLVTACPLCKKTFAKHSPVPVKDIAEVMVESMR